MEHAQIGAVVITQLQSEYGTYNTTFCWHGGSKARLPAARR